MPGGRAERIILDAFKQFPGVYFENPFFWDGFGLFENVALVLKKFVQGVREVLQACTLREIAFAAETRVIENAGFYLFTSVWASFSS